MVHRDDGTAAGEGTRSNGLIQLEWWQTPEADQVRHHFQWVWLFSRGRDANAVACADTTKHSESDREHRA